MQLHRESERAASNQSAGAEMKVRRWSQSPVPECLAWNGDPGGSRTPNPQIRSLMLYPVELRGRYVFSSTTARVLAGICFCTLAAPSPNLHRFRRLPDSPFLTNSLPPRALRASRLRHSRRDIDRTPCAFPWYQIRAQCTPSPTRSGPGCPSCLRVGFRHWKAPAEIPSGTMTPSIYFFSNVCLSIKLEVSWGGDERTTVKLSIFRSVH
jgi:hypothetical protein